MDERVCARRFSRSRRCVARSTFSESEVERASVLARVEGCAVEGAWVRPDSRLAVERISARSCFLCARETVRNSLPRSSYTPWRLGWVGAGGGGPTVCPPGTWATTVHPDPESIVGVQSARFVPP